MLLKIQLCFLLFGFLLRSQAQQQELTKYKWEILPTTHLVPLYTADSRAHRLSIQKPFDSRGYIGSMGGIFPLASLSNGKQKLQFSAASSVYTTLKRWDSRGQLVNIDFFVDVFIDLELNKHFSLRSGAGHTSQHLSDDALQAGLVPINFVRDYYQAFVNYKNAQYHLFTYGGIIYNHNFKTTADISGMSILQLGLEHSPINWGTCNFIYYAGDIKFREESNFGNSLNLQLGYKYATENSRVFRLAVNYFNGLSEVGQTYRQLNEQATISLYFDF